MRLGELLVMRGATTQEHVEEALAEQRRLREAGIDEWLGQILLRRGHVDRAALAAALAELSLLDAAAPQELPLEAGRAEHQHDG